ncbi:penicillin-binding protein 2 [Candidatus Saccharibacteria bacterium]|nr:penicillin-binding protein 2 [Candidatus Saccharibacteria bacterium]MCB9834825.1 penicillin-binding protein 2 [Candidatus Nomurabacteria bacterium]
MGKINIFGDHYDQGRDYQSSSFQQKISDSELWSSQLLAGSSEQRIEEEVDKKFFKLLFLPIIFVASLFIGQLFNLQFIEANNLDFLAQTNRLRSQLIRAPRGIIYDRNSQPLLRNTSEYQLVLNPTLLDSDSAKLEQDLQAISQIIDLDHQAKLDQIQSKLRQRETIVIADKIEKDQAISLQELEADLSGFGVEIRPSREYLYPEEFAHILGYTGRVTAEDLERSDQYQVTDIIGKLGLEQQYNQTLSGEDGKIQFEVDSTGQPIRFRPSQEPVDGEDLVTTLDLGLQEEAYKVIEKYSNQAGSGRGSMMAIDPNNGEILAAVNYPSYDNNLFDKGIGQADYDQLVGDPDKPLFDRLIGGSYPVGSIIKPLISLAGLESGVIDQTTTYNDTGSLIIENIYDPSIVYQFKGWNPAGLGPVNVIRALALSSDIFYYIVGGGYKDLIGLGGERLTDWYQKFGLGKLTGVNIPGESAGNLPSPAKWAEVGRDWLLGDSYNISIGQGELLATPLQMLYATASIFGGGKFYQPNFVKSIGDQVVESKVVQENVYSEVNRQLVLEGMRQAASSLGTAGSIFASLPFRVAGKTGTAETSTESGDSNQIRSKAHAWFTVGAPDVNTQIVMIVMIENAGEGSAFAAPAAQEILSWWAENRY